MSIIPVDASIAPELIEFWAKKYKETKDELDTLKVGRSQCLNTRIAQFFPQENATYDLVSKNEEILSVVRSIKSTVVDDATLRQELETVSQEKDALVARLAQVEAERDALSTQVRGQPLIAD